jgi:hypothetical protein
MEALSGLVGLITFGLSIVVLIVFFVMASNISTIVGLLRRQNEILTHIFKASGGKVLDEKGNEI